MSTTEEQGFSIEPSPFCPHVEDVKHFQQLTAEEYAKLPVFGTACHTCNDKTENWLCISCYKSFCSRFVQGHAKKHFEDEGHAIVLGYNDLSFWCYECETYIKSPLLQTLYSTIHYTKFNVYPGETKVTAEEMETIQPFLNKEPQESNNNTQDEVEKFMRAQFPWLVPRNKETKTNTYFIEGLDEKILANKTIDRLLGCLYGNALGDAVGLATEFMNKDEIIRLYGEDKIPFPKYKRNFHNSRWEYGDWTDDTDQMILIMETILEREGQVDALTFAKKLLDWVHQGFPELGDFGGLGLGQTVASVVKHPIFLANPHKSSQIIWNKLGQNAAANGLYLISMDANSEGALMRTSILGCYQFNQIDKVIENTLNICKVTHHDSRCQASCVLADTIISYLLQNPQDSYSDQDIDALIKKGLDHALPLLDPKYMNEFSAYVVKDASVESLYGLKLDEREKIGYTLKCLGSAIWGLRSTRSFEDTINLLVREGGDADTNGAICGALIGAKIGYSNLPKEWLIQMPNKWWLDAKVKKFLELMKLV